MNSRERFLAALSGQTPDRTPTAHVAALTNVEAQERTGCFMPGAHLDPDQLARLCYANHELFGFDAVTFILNYFNEPAALGADINWGQSTELPVFTSHPWTEVEDAGIPEDLLDRPPVSTYLECLRIAKRDYGSRVAVLGKIMGPFSMTQVMHGVDNVMLGSLMDPDKIRAFLEISTQLLIRCANAQFEQGIDALAIGEGGAGAKMMSPTLYEELLLEAHQRMLSQIQGPTIMHICGDITPRLPALSKIGLACFNFDWAIDPQALKKAAAGQFKVMGNINTTDLMQGSPEQIEEQVFRCLEAEVDIISPGCAVSPRCPTSNFQALTSAVNKWKAA